MLDSLFGNLWNAVVVILVTAILSLLGLGCIAQGRMVDGEVNATYQPAIIWRVDTGLYFNAATAPLLELKNAKVEGTAESRPDD